jgi:hypothetical protein
MRSVVDRIVVMRRIPVYSRVRMCMKPWPVRSARSEHSRTVTVAICCRVPVPASAARPGPDRVPGPAMHSGPWAHAGSVPTCWPRDPQRGPTCQHPDTGSGKGLRSGCSRCVSEWHTLQLWECVEICSNPPYAPVSSRSMVCTRVYTSRDFVSM